jgi:vancomycin permeability regulator SanA
MALDAIAVLGCRLGEHGRLLGTARRRVEHAARLFRDGAAPVVIASGGKVWFGVSEADAFGAVLIDLGVPAELSHERGFRKVGIVTSDWHMPRALAAFARFGIAVEACPAATPDPSLRGRLYRYASERVRGIGDVVTARWFDRGAR